ncbi:MAG: hypothetical protein UR63_C0012G0018 [Candidatus Roizmanbacteria bacterium GW2011_GWC2_35_12]|uniref:DUF711 domain-containing protein n=1 Tax=Candidatus Roizmanbacteria bacterium GW2011_GWC2_35_12 TaxID=1618485 RepID=A0A0G0BDG8_9BACT|nr:MAG: hypothetical protein UR63_C0012G0018 [Candidatus Roizmanbacteria bacterium GW2011_GWC2_35_12]
MSNKIIRTICYFQKEPNEEVFQKLDNLEKLFKEKGFEVQTKRLNSPNISKVIELDNIYAAKGYFLSVGSAAKEEVIKLSNSNNIAFNINLTNKPLDLDEVDILFNIIKNNNFTYVFNNPVSSPFFPAANYGRDGFSIGLQPTNLAEGCTETKQWLGKMKVTWTEITQLLATNEEFIGIDSSIAPFRAGNSSLVNFIRKLSGTFEKSVTTNIYTQITEFIKKENPKPVGLCGLMFPCLEDFELTDEYEKGNFSIERNIYLSLHSGVGIDTYPIGIDEKPERVLEILKLIQNLSNKFKKSLSARFVSDGKSKIGEKTNFKSKYLKDTIIKPL